MAFESLSDRLQGAVSNVGKKGKITEADFNEMMREVRLALLEADVNFRVVKDFVRKVKERAQDADVLDSVSPSQQIVKIVNDELTDLMGGEHVPFNYSKESPSIAMMVGLQGAGKTTTAGKLANFLRKQDSKKPLLVAADVYRPAAVDQLKTLGEQLNIDVFEKGVEVDPVDIAREAVEYAKANGHDLVFVDTAGRLQIDENLMTELANIKETVQPDEILLTVDAMSGQEAANVAATFNEQLDITGVILTKLDGDSRGGAALSIVSVTGKPIKFAGTGEKLEDIERFHPDRMANRILGMGDIVSLVEKAQEDFDEAQAEEMAAKMKANAFDFNDFISQMEQVNKMGPISDIIKMIPGMNKIPGLSDVKIDPKDMAHVKAMVQSMTPYERENPDEISQSRRRRIAKGSGNDIADVNRMIKQFNQSRQMMADLSNGNMGAMQGMMNQMGGMGGGGFGNKLDQVRMNQLARKAGKKKNRHKRRK